jgi:hypothetical protein
MHGVPNLACQQLYSPHMSTVIISVDIQRTNLSQLPICERKRAVLRSRRLGKSFSYNRWDMLHCTQGVCVCVCACHSLVSIHSLCFAEVIRTLVQTHNRDVGMHARPTSSVSMNQGVRFNAARPATWNHAQRYYIRKYMQLQRHRDGCKEYRNNGVSSACISVMRRRRQLVWVFGVYREDTYKP